MVLLNSPENQGTILTLQTWFKQHHWILTSIRLVVYLGITLSLHLFTSLNGTRNWKDSSRIARSARLLSWLLLIEILIGQSLFSRIVHLLDG